MHSPFIVNNTHLLPHINKNRTTTKRTHIHATKKVAGKKDSKHLQIKKKGKKEIRKEAT